VADAIALGRERHARRAAHRLAHRSRTYFTSAIVCAVIFLLSAAQSTDVFHWFAIPVFLCGVVIGADAVDWVVGRRDLFDPVGVLGLLGLHVFCLAPYLHVVWQQWMRYIEPPPEWRDWLGLMACLNLVGLVLYRATVSAVEAHRSRQPAESRWQIEPQRCGLVLGLAMVVTFATQVVIYVQFGGVSGYIEEFARGGAEFAGLGIIFMVGETFPVLALIGYAIWVKARKRVPGWGELAAVLVAMLVLKLLFGGLRGSRSNTVWAMFWAVGIIHFWIRPVPRHLVVWGIIGLVGFMYAYGFYKVGGLDTLIEAAQGQEARDRIAEKNNRTVEAAILTDLGRADGQAFLLYRLLRPGADYEYAWGRTYVGAVALVVPRSLWEDRPETKRREGTDLMYGQGKFAEGRFFSSNVYGMAGEAMLNFGPWVVPLFYIPLGVLVGWSASLNGRLASDDVRRLLLPLLINLAFVALMGDSDNIVVFLFQNAAIPFFTLLACSRKVEGAVAPEAGGPAQGVAPAGLAVTGEPGRVRGWGKRSETGSGEAPRWGARVRRERH
jgi:hypothetical protein